MSDIQLNVLKLASQCSELVSATMPRSGKFDSLSESTKADYLRLARTLFSRSSETAVDLREIVNDTTSPRTFQKRLASLRYFLHVMYHRLINSTCESDGDQLPSIYQKLNGLRKMLQAFAPLQNTGLQGKRTKRQSKRKALSGLPDDWRESLYERSKAGKYGLAILVASLSGCRPAELKKGIRIWRIYDERLQSEVINIEIQGVKVKENQGQPHRLLQYSVLAPHPLITAINGLLDQQAQQALHVQITNSSNLTVEIRRLSKSLWPKHPHAITAYCFRHQWAADMKKTQPPESVSQGLGHLSPKTRSNYGQAQQARQTGILYPLAISAERSIKSLSRQPPTRDYSYTNTPFD